MSAPLNRNTLLWAIGVMQPISMSEINQYLVSVLPNAGAMPDTELLQHLAMEETKAGNLIRVGRNPDLFSLTLHGNRFLTKAQRQSRDRERIFLLRGASRSKVVQSREASAVSLDGDAPSQPSRVVIEGSEARAPGPSVPQARALWPRHSKQLFDKTGSSSNSRDTFIPLLSFSNPSQLVVARGEKGLPWADCTALGLMIGISPQLILQIYARPFRHYRSFTIPKKTGAPRQIEAPRVFLKTVQSFIADYLMSKMPVHDSVHSFRFGRSITSNASPHVRRQWVANIDILNFFNSISISAVASLFARNGFDPTSARILAALTTYMGRLPQGAPSSPNISNAILYDFDARTHESCSRANLHYTRYADDISISGEDRKQIETKINEVEIDLQKNYGLRLNFEKQRIISNRSQQRVTGVVVNEKVMPPRKLRREIRAALYNASKSGFAQVSDFQRMKGYLSHFSSYADFNETKEFKNLLLDFEKARRRLYS